jgi:serine/alanine adding enzyme
VSTVLRPTDPAAEEDEAAAPVDVVETDDGARWDEFVRAHPQATACHLFGWRRVMEGALGNPTRFYAAVDRGGAWRGVLPLVTVRSRIFGHYLVSMPFLNDGGPIGGPASRARLAERAIADGRRQGADLVELRGRTPIPVAATAPPRKVTRHLALPATADELWEKGFRAKLRSQVRRPMKEGMEFRAGPDELAAFYAVFARNMRDLGTPVLPRAWFEGIARWMPENVCFGAVYRAGRPVAGACALQWKGELEMTWASSLREHATAAPNMLLYWGMLQEAVARGCTVFNFGRCTPGSATHRFKEQWGGVDVPLPWLEWSPRGVAGTPSPERPLFRLATRAWSRLPMAVANRLGPVLSRRIP